MTDPLFEEFLSRFETEISEQFPVLQGFEFNDTSLRKLFHEYFSLIAHANVPITPTVGQLLGVLELDPEMEYEVQDEDFRNRLIYPLGEAFRCAMEPLRYSEYAKRERAKATEKTVEPKTHNKEVRPELRKKVNDTSRGTNWRERLESKASFTVREASGIADETTRSLGSKIDKPGRPGPLKFNEQGRITQQSLKDYLLKEKNHKESE
ncbi:hypothetical protein MYX82_06920 [Acidobacteria bacterium AH-259-D05]|nr:hypothetical protein [Acidobacteria bacterium AH-259-D05]